MIYSLVHFISVKGVAKMRSKLLEKRLELGLTRSELAEIVGLSEIFVRKLENGSRNPSVTTMLKFQVYYGESMQKLFPDVFQLN